MAVGHPPARSSPKTDLFPPRVFLPGETLYREEFGAAAFAFDAGLRAPQQILLADLINTPSVTALFFLPQEPPSSLLAPRWMSLIGTTPRLVGTILRLPPPTFCSGGAPFVATPTIPN